MTGSSGTNPSWRTGRVSDDFDLSGPAAKVVLAVMARASKMERLAINERIAAARIHREAAAVPGAGHQ